MTTIACNRETMAADSMASVDYSGFVYRTRKIHRVPGALFGISGSAGAARRFLRWYEAGQDYENLPEFDPESEYFVALKLTREGIFRYEGICDPIHVLDDYAASGDGAAIALTAMRYGATPYKAVEVACELNGPTGPPVIVEKL